MMEGIDVSYCQAGFDFQAAADAGKEFCIVRIGRTRSDGRQELDDYFVDNINGAKAAGMKLGIYFYSLATTEAEAQQEAQWLLDTMHEYLDGVDLEAGIWYDVEDAVQMNGLSPEELTSVVMAWVNTMNAAGVYCGIYSYYSMFNDNFELGSLPNYVPLWVANTASVNYLKVENPELNIPVWQYSDAGNIAGINVDLDVWY
ncbi:GH25 family lysozyme [Megasphaera elsdenii]|uniref:GH25 family lysozyme n=1 Tax=Megasphaera elsdenii TaxID=907 RepID=UPI003D0745A8